MAFTNPVRSYCTTQNHTPNMDIVEHPYFYGTLLIRVSKSRLKAGKRLHLGKKKVKELQTLLYIVNYISKASGY